MSARNTNTSKAKHKVKKEAKQVPTIPVYFRCPPKLVERFMAVAAANDFTKNAAFQQALRDFIDEHGDPEKQLMDLLNDLREKSKHV